MAHSKLELGKEEVKDLWDPLPERGTSPRYLGMAVFTPSILLLCLKAQAPIAPSF